MKDWRAKQRALRRFEHDAPADTAENIAQLAAALERNKTRRRRDDDPPAAAPAPVEPRPRGGGLTGGAAAVMTFEQDE